MSRVPSTATRRPAQRAANSPAVAGFRPASAAWAVAAAFTLQPFAAQAQPTGAQVIHGAATIAGSNGNLVVTTRNGVGTNYSAINWQSFSVPAGTVTRFDQPSATSTSINRVVGADPSAIFGTLRSNGRLVLVNPAGIAVGAGAVVDTAAFTASTLPMTDADALSGRQAFGGNGGALQVDGTVIARSGDVVLVAPQVQAGETALIRSQGATVLAAGHKVAITGRGLEGIALEVQAGDRAVNLGTLQGDAVGIFAGTLHHSGVVEASAASVEGGKVVLKASGGDALVDGRITASGSNGHGGSIDVLGRRVGLLAGASLDASGAAGGGQVRVGGDYQGHNAQVPNAARTYVDAGATIRADATQRGDGGRVIVWSDEATRMHGRISARGGAQGGNGGFAEVSGKQYLDFAGSADLRAPRGDRGTLLLDPSDVDITHGGSDTVPQSASGNDTIFSDAPASPSTISDATINSQLINGNVLVTTSSSVGSAAGQITLASDAVLQWSNGNGLGLQADAGIVLNGTIAATQAGSLTLIAHGGDIVGSGKIEVGSLLATAGAQSTPGNVFLTNTANKIGAIAGSAIGSAAQFTVRNAQALTIGSVSTPWGGGSGVIVTDGSTNTGKVDIATSTGAITLLSGEGATVAAGEVYLKAASTADGDVQIDNGTINAGTGPLDIQAGRDLLFGTTASPSSLSLSGAGSVNLGAGRDMHLGDKVAVETSSSLSIDSGGPIALTAGGSIYSGSRTGSTSYSTVSIYGYGGAPANGISVQAGGDIDFGVPDSCGCAATSITTYQAPISVVAGNSILGVVDLTTHGSSSADPLDGSITMTATNGSLSFGTLSSSAETEGVSSHPSGAVKLSAKGSITGNAIYTEGGYGDSLGAGDGGAVTVTSTTGAVNITTIETYGGEGGYSYTSLGSAPGGVGGSVAITAAGDVTVGTVDASGGYAYNGASGGNAGNVSITSSGGNIAINSSIHAYGGDAYGSSVGPANGGMGGTVTLTADAGNISAEPYADIAVDGGYGSGGGNGGAAGTVKVKAPNGAVTIESISAIGGGGDQGGSGGSGGTVEVAAGGDIMMVPSYGFSVAADGGTSGQGAGGRGGSISLVSTGGSIAADATSAEVPALVPPTNGYGGVSAVGGYGGTGGAGGSILMDAATDITTGGVYALGGDSNAGGTGQAGGAGGSAHLRFGNSLGASQVVVVGGTGDTGTNGGNGGAGGSIWLERTSATGDLVLDGTTALMAYGGYGGDATFDAGGVGGTGGAGGTISLGAAGGSVVLHNPLLGAYSGGGGLNADDSTYAQPGALGTIATSGPVEVDGNLDLNARWVNTGTVNVRGSSVVYGGGIFANQGGLNLFDTAVVDTDGGVDNQASGTITASGSDVALNLVHNAGLLKVAAGASLGTRGFTTNAGTVLVDGTLAIGDATSCSRCTAMVAAAVDPAAGIFTNEAGGVVGGSGTISLTDGTGTLDNFGTLKPGGLGTIGTLTLTGNLYMESGSTLATDLVSTSSHDALVVSGAATSGGTIAVNYLQGAAFGVGDTFSVLQSASLDASTLPAVSAQELDPTASGNALVLVANAAYPPPPPPPPPPAPPPPPPAPPPPAPAPAPAEQQSAVQQVSNQVVTFAQLFVQEAQRQEDDKKDGPAGKDDIVISDNACKPS